MNFLQAILCVFFKVCRLWKGMVIYMEKKNKRSIAEIATDAMDKLASIGDKFADEFVTSMEEKMYEDKFCFDSCIKFCKEQKSKIPAVAGFVLSVKKNDNYPNTLGKYIIIQGLIDRNDKPISLDGKECVSRTIRADDVDEKTITYLDGDTTRIFTIK